jgi:chromodomain-helicase-DNA-binding protein 1
LLGSFQVAAEEPEEEEDNGDAIERVLWHQPKGIAEAEADEGRHAEPFVLDTDPHAELVWEDQEFYIKWKGQSYLHCQWMLLSELTPVSENEHLLPIVMRTLSSNLIRIRSIVCSFAWKTIRKSIDLLQ